MKISKRKVVTIDYRLTDPTGELLDRSEDGEPLSYLHGEGNIVPGLEEALEGRAAGDTLQVTVPPEKGYGTKDETLIHDIPRANFPEGDMEVGMQFHAEDGGEERLVTVVALSADQVTVDGNHPLAGMTLSFQVSVRGVRAATAEELRHGHVHGAGGHHH